MTPTVLLYNLTGPRGSAIQALGARFGLAVRQVPPMDQGRTLAALLGLPSGSPGGGGAVPGEMLVMAFLERDTMEAFLDAFPKNGIPPVPLKAVLTPANSGWTGLRLYRELQKEHRAADP